MKKSMSVALIAAAALLSGTAVSAQMKPAATATPKAMKTTTKTTMAPKAATTTTTKTMMAPKPAATMAAKSTVATHTTKTASTKTTGRMVTAKLANGKTVTYNCSLAGNASKKACK